MLRKNTVFVVGAGASCEVKFPAGVELRDKIAEWNSFELDDWGRIASSTKYTSFANALLGIPHFDQNTRRMATAAAKISGGIGFASSVDTFLEIHASDGDIQACAKAAICKIIADHERKSPLFVDTSNDYNVMNTRGLINTWLQELSPLLFEKNSIRSACKTRSCP